MTNEAFDAIEAGLKDAIAYARGDTSRGNGRDYPTADLDIVADRRKTGLSSAQLSRAVGVSRSTLARWERGQGRPTGPARRLLQVMAKHPEAVLDVLDG